MRPNGSATPKTGHAPSRLRLRAHGAPREHEAAGGSTVRTLLVALFLFSQVGCFWAAIGATAAGLAGYAYWQGKVCHAYVADLGDAMKATKTALAELGMTVSKEEANDAAAILKTRAADGTKVTIKLRRETSQIPSEGTITEVCVRVGAFGDHPLSGRILYQISAHLVPVAPPGTPAPPGGPVAAPGAPPLTPGPMPPPGPAGVPPRFVSSEPPLAAPGAPVPPPSGPVTPASWAPVKTGEPPLSK